MTDNTHNNTPAERPTVPWLAVANGYATPLEASERTPERRREREWRELETDKAALEQATPFRE